MTADYDEFESGEKPAKSKGSFHTAENTLNEDRREKLLDELPAEEMRGPYVPLYILRVTANATDAIVLAQISYWLGERRGKQPRNGVPFKWTAITSAEMGRQLGRTDDEIDKALRRLRKQGFVDWKTKLFEGKKQRHLWIVWDKIAQACEDLKEDQPDDSDQ